MVFFIVFCFLKDHFKSFNVKFHISAGWFCWPCHVSVPFPSTLTAPVSPFAGNVWHHSWWEPAGGRMWAYGRLPGGLLEKHSPHQLQPPWPSASKATHSQPALQHGPGLWRAGTSAEHTLGQGRPWKRRGSRSVGGRIRKEEMKEIRALKNYNAVITFSWLIVADADDTGDPWSLTTTKHVKLNRIKTV